VKKKPFFYQLETEVDVTYRSALADLSKPIVPLSRDTPDLPECPRCTLTPNSAIEWYHSK
jgi:hypothetical protein